MWVFKTVEWALFHWGEWRCSLIRQWAKNDTRYQLLPGELNLLARSQIESLGLEGIGFTFYWVCCLVSDINLDYKESFMRIVIPMWWTQEYNEAFSVYGSAGSRLVPPNLVNEKDLDFFLQQYEIELFSDNRGYVFLPSNHRLNVVLNKLKGRPMKRGGVGRDPIYSDRLAVRCAELKKLGNSPLQISELVSLPKEVYIEGEGPDVIRHLIKRGDRLIMENMGEPDF